MAENLTGSRKCNRQKVFVTIIKRHKLANSLTAETNSGRKVEQQTKYFDLLNKIKIR